MNFNEKKKISIKKLSFAEIHICGDRNGLETVASIMPQVFLFPGENPTKTFLFETGTSKHCKCSLVQRPSLMKQRKKAPISEFQRCGTDDSRKTFQLLTLSQDENKC